MQITDLAGKAVLVTGASTGIGAAVAKGFAAQGARVAVHYNASAAQAEKPLRCARMFDPWKPAVIWSPARINN